MAEISTAGAAEVGEMPVKRCIKCGEIKPRTEFYFNRSTRGHSSRCKACKIATVRDWQSRNAERAREHRRAYKERHREDSFADRTGITLDQFRSRRQRQEGRCAVCREERRLFVVDPAAPLVCADCRRGLDALGPHLSHAASVFACYTETDARERTTCP